MAGAPSAHRDYDAREAVRILYLLIAALPSHLPVYCYGEPENREAMLKCDAEEDAAATKAEAITAAISDLTRELWGDPDGPEPDIHEDWSIQEMRRLVKALARVAGVRVPPWA